MLKEQEAGTSIHTECKRTKSKIQTRNCLKQGLEAATLFQGEKVTLSDGQVAK